ncbi:sn-glycerol-1-phosphate dehydrogenase [Paenibacillus oryzisoli]|uniref:sn-glycerol-1-phosphate dehydrogenase n=1 Tax=Paenibacillus oryzisoli TaxID=1850517 RepID=UPI003D299F9C
MEQPNTQPSAHLQNGEHHPHHPGVDVICIKAGALPSAAAYIAERPYRSVLLAADANTYAAAGERLCRLLTERRVSVHAAHIQPGRAGDVLADEAALIELLLDIQRMQPDLLVAVGGGTIHDIVRYCAFTTRIPFLSVPTAPSVDGFNSLGAPIITRGRKITVPAVGPEAMFADLDVLVQAPSPLIAAGFGDMLGKATSLFDWQFGALVAEEPYLQASADTTRQALATCISQVGSIARKDAEGIHTLMSALTQSGLAMLRFGQSHPASGSEHHLSHYWEMAYIQQGRKQLLHGAKVGVACAQISRLYHRLTAEGAEHWSGMPNIASRWNEIAQLIHSIPVEVQLQDLLREVGGPATTEELGIDPQLLTSSLLEGHLVRPARYTLLRAYNERSILT